MVVTFCLTNPEEDGTRVLTRATFLRAIGRRGKAKGGREYDDEFKTPVFLTANNLKPFINIDIGENSTPVIFDLKLFRLKNLPYPPISAKRPSYIGHWTNDIVYDRLAPGVLSDLRKKNPL